MRILNLRVDTRAVQTIWCVLLFAVSASGTNLTVKSGGGGNFTTIQACAAAMAAGDTCTVYAGTYNEKVTVPAGTAGNYKTITVNGSDVVTVQSFTLNSHTKLVGNCSTVPSSINTCGFNIQNPSSPSSATCVTMPSGTTDVYITRNVMYACGSGAMMGVAGGDLQSVSYVYVQGNTLSYACITQAQAGTATKECNGMQLSGNHFLVENNDLSHYTLGMVFEQASYAIFRSNTIHDEYETEAGGNSHTDAFYSSTTTTTDHNVIEGNTQYNGFGVDAKGVLAQGQYSPCNGACAHGLIYRYNVVHDLQGSNLSGYGYNYVKIYNNTFSNLSSSGGVNNFLTSSFGMTYGADINNIFYFPNAVAGDNPIAVDSGSALGGVWGHDLAYCNATGASNCNLYSHLVGSGTWTNDPGNILGYIGHVPSNNPNFINLSGNNFHLQVGSPAIAAGTYLTTVAPSDSGSGTSLIVSDAAYFQDGYGLSNANSMVKADCIAIGTATNQVCITVVNYSTNTLTLASSISRSAGQGVYLYSKSDGAQVLIGSAPDIGAYPYAGGNSGSVVPPTILSEVIQ